MRKMRLCGLLAAFSAMLLLTACGKDAAKQTQEPAETAIPEPTKAVTQDAEPTGNVTPTGEAAPTGEPTPTNEPIPTEDPDENGGKTMSENAKLLYQGHGSVRITTPEGKTIYVDPFMGDGYDVPADLILITHSHYDHTQTQLITSKNADCKTVTWAEALAGGTHQNFDFGFVKVEAVEAGYNKNHSVKDCVGYVLTFSDGVTLYLTGDTSTTQQMPALASRNLDYAFFCCDGVYNMGMEEAIACAKTVGAKHSIPYHMVPAQQSGFDRTVAEKFDVPGRIIVAPGEVLTLE